MSEKRFSVGIRRKDNEVFYSFFDGDNPLDLDNIVDLLNEQQKEIERLQKIIDLAQYQLKVQDRILKEVGE